ncbi:MAG: tryptophan--tRNA ligase [Streptosporangiales bacterium]|nr:tryptophan--tRNA ligase [Streptosporangiales bacterium]
MSDAVPAARPRVLSGIAATGKLHIGNYIGALSVWAKEQDRYENFFFIADLHALTIPENVPPDYLREHVREIVALYLACGLDPDRSVLFLQSRVPAHPTLAWIFDCLTPVSWLERMTQYKAKSEQASPSAGLLTYPALQAADILLYQPKYVPVGDDQRQHVELSRDIAGRFNHLYGDLFVIPEPLIRQSGARIMGLDDPAIKMSKSLAEKRDGHAIALLDPPDTVRRTVMRAVTDSNPALRRDNLSPGVENLLVLYEILSGSTREQALHQFEGNGYGPLKTAVADLAVDTVAPIQSRYNDIRADDTYLDKVLAEGAEKAAAVADHTLHRVMQRVGLA